MPVPKWSFEMDFTQLFINASNRDKFGDILNKAVVSCSWPERSINSIPVYFAGVEGKLPGRAINSGELEIKFNENTTFAVTKALEELKAQYALATEELVALRAMKEKIEQLCDQIKDLLKKNDREYIVANVPMSTEEAGDYCLPEYYKTIIGDLSVDFLEKLNT